MPATQSRSWPYSPVSTTLVCLVVAAQNPGERQRFNIHGPQPINTLSASWIEVSYRRLLENARLVLQVVSNVDLETSPGTG